MKFLHLGDLHIGKRLNEVDLLEDQKHVLEQAVELSDRADAVLIAGDVYDKAVPSAEAMSVFDGFISELVAKGKKIFIISGNHDNDQRISYFSSLLKKNEVYVTSRFEGKLQSYELEDEYGKLCVHLLPFVKPSSVRLFYPEIEIASHEDAVKAVLDNSPVDTSIRNIIVAHQFITNSETSESEERWIGGQDNISAELFDSFDYVALGHIHKPQKISRDTLRYAGSILKYSFSETRHVKSFPIIDIKEKGNIELEFVPIKFLHDVIEKEGLLEELMKEPYCTDYARITLLDEDVEPDARYRLQTIFPNMMKMAIRNSKTYAEADIIAEQEFENKTIKELFVDFYRYQNNSVDPSEAELKLLEKVIEKIGDRQ